MVLLFYRGQKDFRRARYTGSPRPVRPASAVMEIVQRYQARGLPTPINGEVLARAGISDSLIPRTLQALETLDLINAEGVPTQVFEDIRRAPEAEYQQRLREWLNRAYAEALQFVDPATADEVAIRDAFRNYNPFGQVSRMVTLFTGLFKAAGVGLEKAAQASRKPAAASPPKARTGMKSLQGLARRVSAGDQTPKPGTLPPALAGLMASLPPEGKGWTQAKRDSFMAAFGTILDFCFPIGAVADGWDDDDADDVADSA